MQSHGTPKRGDLYWLDWNPARGSEQAGRRPALVVSMDPINRSSPVVIVAAVTGRVASRPYGFQVPVPLSIPTGLTMESTVLCQQLITVSKDRLGRQIGALPPDLMRQVDQALRVALGLT